jgi:hypothetical protein
MANTAGGFLSRGIKLRGGNYSFAPLEWKHVESTGDDLRKGIMPLPVREPSQVLFTLLSLLINYGERIGISVDILTGQNPGQNTPAETSRTMAEQGMKIFSGIFKRTYRALRDEFRKQYRLNQLYITETKYFTDARDAEGTVLAKDYLGDVSAIRPEADPHIISDSQRVLQAEMLRGASKQAPGYNIYEVERRYLQALKVQGIDQLLPDPNGPNAIKQGPSEKVQVEQIKAQAAMVGAQVQMKLGVMKLIKEADLNQAKIKHLEAQAIKALEEAKGITTGTEVSVIQAQLDAFRTHHESLMNQIETMNVLADKLGQQEQAAAPAA